MGGFGFLISAMYSGWCVLFIPGRDDLSVHGVYSSLSRQVVSGDNQWNGPYAQQGHYAIFDRFLKGLLQTISNGRIYLRDERIEGQLRCVGGVTGRRRGCDVSHDILTISDISESKTAMTCPESVVTRVKSNVDHRRVYGQTN